MAHRGVGPGHNCERMGGDVSIILVPSTRISDYAKGSRDNGAAGWAPPTSIMGSLRGPSVTRSPAARRLLAEEPLEAPRSASCFPLAPLGDPSVVLLLGPGRLLLAEEPPVAPLGVLFGG